MDWFESLMGFRETGYHDTRARLAVEGDRLHSLVNGQSYRVGRLELVSLETLRERAKAAGKMPGELHVSVLTGEVRQMHRLPQYSGALFQVASQFNLLEMTAPNVTPEDGVTRYQQDLTQGPACAIAAGAATIYRNYFALVGNHRGQTADRQIDALADLGEALKKALGLPAKALWQMRNGYALCSRSGLDAITDYLASLNRAQLDVLRSKLCIGLHSDVEVTDASKASRQLVSQAFCSALPIAYTRVPLRYWKAFASLVLQAAYEATVLAAILNAHRGASNIVLLTELGGGAFGNDRSWIHAAMKRALEIVQGVDLDVRLVSHGPPSPSLVEMAELHGVPRPHSP